MEHQSDMMIDEGSNFVNISSWVMQLSISINFEKLTPKLFKDGGMIFLHDREAAGILPVGWFSWKICGIRLISISKVIKLRVATS